jgi:hypothetical protein
MSVKALDPSVIPPALDHLANPRVGEAAHLPEPELVGLGMLRSRPIVAVERTNGFLDDLQRPGPPARCAVWTERLLSTKPLMRYTRWQPRAGAGAW